MLRSRKLPKLEETSGVAFSLLACMWRSEVVSMLAGVAVIDEGREGGHEVLSVNCRSRAAEEVTEGCCVRS